MQHRSIYKNLDTSFVNLSALIKHLRRRQFVGGVRVQLNGYSADITLNEDNTIRVHEHDEISGRIAEGEEAFQRLLIRAREPGGTINVFQTVAEKKKPVRKPSQPRNKVKVEMVSATVVPEAVPVAEIPKPAEPLKFHNRDRTELPNGTIQNGTQAGRMRSSQRGPGARVKKTKPNTVVAKPVSSAATPKVETRPPGLPGFPFQLSNKMEAKAQQMLSSTEDWQSLLKITVELLSVVDRSLATANLNFGAEFRKVRTEIAGDYPFLNPTSEIFDYAQGKMRMTKQMNAKIFISGVSEALRKILIKLSKSQKYSEIYKMTSQRLQIVIQKRTATYEKFAVTSQIRRIVSP